MRQQLLRIAPFLVLACICVAPLLAAVPGGFSDVAVDDPGVQAAAKFAVEERAKTEPKLTLDKITKANRQVVAGLNYDLTLTVTVGTEKKTAVVRVWAKLDKTHELSSWAYVKN
jgi:hypothetical protein